MQTLLNLLTNMDDLEWRIADLINEKKNTDRLIRATQYNHHRLTTMARVAADWPEQLRDYDLPFSIHVELVGCDNKSKKELLKYAKENKLSAVELRKEIRKTKKSKVVNTTNINIRLNQDAKKEYYATKKTL